jgi:hypothetical protein
MKTRYYVGHETDLNCAVYAIDGEYLAHVVPDWDWIEESDGARKWSTASKGEANAVARRFRGFGAVVYPYTVPGK